MISKLTEIANKRSRLIIGLMSGTSLDGLDVALCRIYDSGSHSKVELLHFKTITYSEEFRSEVRTVFSKRLVDLEKVCLLNAFIGRLHAACINQCLTEWEIATEAIDCIASHGQTIYHAPQRLHHDKKYLNATLQIGDGDHIAVATGILTLSDFRQKHIAAGGEGAPLAMYGDYLMFTSPEENRILLNIGGISNFTFLPKNGDVDQVISSDIGPGNTLIDALAQKYFNIPYDENSRLAKGGTVNETLLNYLLGHRFFAESMPKSTGPELFNLQLIQDAIDALQLQFLSANDIIATATRLTAAAIASQIELAYDKISPSIYVSGGGAHNVMVMDTLRILLPDYVISKADVLGISGDAKEAVLFAVLANETLCGSVTRLGGSPAVTMGKMSFPG